MHLFQLCVVSIVSVNSAHRASAAGTFRSSTRKRTCREYRAVLKADT